MTLVCRTSVSTVAVPVRDRLAYWEQYNAEALVGLTCTTYDERGLIAHQVNLDLGGVRVAEISGNPHVIERAPRTVASAPKGSTFVTLLTAGDAFFYHESGFTRLEPGDAIVYDTDRPYLFGFGTDMRQLLVDLPSSSELGLLPPSAPLLVQGRGPGSRPAAARRLVRTLETVVAELGERGAASGPGPGAAVQEAVSALVLDPSTAGRAAVLSAFESFVDEHLAEPSLSPDEVAAALGFSTRHLNRLLREEGTSVGRRIADRRLRQARADLSDPALAHRSIGEIAHRWAFASQAHFATSFRRAFGVTPSTWRSDAHGGRTPD